MRHVVFGFGIQIGQNCCHTVGDVSLTEPLLWWQSLHHLVGEVGQLEELISAISNILRQVEVMFLCKDIVNVFILGCDLKVWAKVDGEDAIVIQLKDDGIFVMVRDSLAQR